MEFRILGPLEVHGDLGVVNLGGAKQRSVLAVLLLRANEPVSADRLALALWGPEAPTATVKRVHVHVSRLRKALGDPDVLITTPAGYRLRVRPGELDADRFEQLVDQGQSTLASGQPERAAATLRDALALWRGPPLADLASEPFAPADIARLEEQRLAAVEMRVEAELAAGAHAELVGELRQMVATYPARERLAGQLMLALYRCGRQSDALDVYQRIRLHLTSELGIEPGPSLRKLHVEILQHQPSLVATAAAQGGEIALRGPSALPVPATPVVGREREIRAVAELVGRDDVRVVTLVGPGGVGKTRLALALAWSLSTRVEWIELAGVERADEVAAVMVERLGVEPQPGEAPDTALRRFLAPKELLLVIDNFEHVLDAAPLVGDLAAAAPGISVLATSREPLDLAAEYRVAVGPLDPASAIAVFRTAATQRDPDFEESPAVGRICERLDGLPLAIELAAARTVLFSPEELLARLGETFDVLAHGPRDAPERQRTLRSTIEWSYHLLTDDERQAFDAFAVFAGGADLRAAQEVTAADLHTLEALVSKSLLLRRGERLTMLQTIRALAAERLVDDARWRHVRYFVTLADEAEGHMFGPQEQLWLDRLEDDADNLRAAFGWALEHAPELALRLANAMSQRWSLVNPLEGRRWFETALAAAGPDAPLRDRATAQRDLAYQLNLLGIDSTAMARTALDLAHEVGDPALEIRARMLIGFVERRSNPAHAKALSEEALREATAAGLGRDAMNAHLNLARVVAAGPEKAAIGEAAMRAVRELGNRRLECVLYADLAHTALLDGRYDDAETLARNAAALIRHRWLRLIAIVSGYLGLAMLLRGRPREAQPAFARSLEVALERVMPDVAAAALGGLAAVAAYSDQVRCATLLAASERLGPYAMAPLDAELERRFFIPARRALEASAWEAARAAGARLSPRELAGLCTPVAHPFSFPPESERR